MDTSDKDINWDKLLAALEGTNTELLNAQEEAMLKESKEIKERLAVHDKFPVNEGWQRFTAARDIHRPRIKWWKPAWEIAAAAAVLAVVITAGLRFWKKESTHHPLAASQADLQPSTRVQLLGNGKRIVLDSVSQTLQYKNGVQVQANSASIVYEAKNGKEETITMDTLLVPRGNKIRVTLADGTVVWMNADSRLVCPTAFNGKTREVSMEGEAFFEVAANSQQPFVVHTAKIDIQVLGTGFNVNTYETTSVQTTLTSGKVRVGQESSGIILTPGEQSCYNEETGALRKKAVDIRIFTAWKDNNIYFEDASLSDITTSLGRSFDYDFKFEDASLAALSFTLDMQRPTNLQDVLNRIHLTIGDVKFRVQGRMVYISR
ncbi:FecR family protein [Chitinophaga sp. 22321]|uniref:FecR domain-containing protein n=1 Tax=Chitinophaga hostae TaxID=2831022 RepID=A0ABS5IXN0_9BACT|nr:FecR family protein [Chitinophaga hostae]MBS0027625.1 FecR domain-containing protein [Chitinophaga hostae]